MREPDPALPPGSAAQLALLSQLFEPPSLAVQTVKSQWRMYLDG